MSCPQVIKVVVPGPPGIGLPAGTEDAGKFLRKAGTEPYEYELVTPDEVGLPQALDATALPTFAGLTLSGLAANRLLFTGTGGAFTGLTLGSGFSIVDGALVATASGDAVTLSMPTGFSVSGSGSSSLGVTFAAGYALPTTAKQGEWDTAYSERLRWDGGATGLNAATARTSLGLGTAATTDASAYATAAQGAKADTAVQPGHPALSDAREWTAATIEQAEAEAGTATNRRAFTAQRVFQAIAAWWAASSAKTKLDGIESGAQVNVPTNLSYDAATRVLASSTGDDATLPVVSTSAAGLAPATSFAALAYGATVNLDLATLDGQVRTITLTGNLELTNSNLAAGRRTVIRLLPGASQRSLTFPIGWVFYSDKPATIAANKGAVLSLTYFGSSDSDCVAVYKQQP